jgi:hypothetical protein
MLMHRQCPTCGNNATILVHFGQHFFEPGTLCVLVAVRALARVAFCPKILSACPELRAARQNLATQLAATVAAHFGARILDSEFWRAGNFARAIRRGEQ